MKVGGRKLKRVTLDEGGRKSESRTVERELKVRGKRILKRGKWV